MNRLLREADIEYELAAEGEDFGRLVAVTDDARSELVHRALHDSSPDITVGVRHAIALFRGRGTSAESKRSAIFNLARVLEERLALIKEHLGKDEGALFEIPNISTCVTVELTSAATTTKPSSTGSSGGTWPRWS